MGGPTLSRQVMRRQRGYRKAPTWPSLANCRQRGTCGVMAGHPQTAGVSGGPQLAIGGHPQAAGLIGAPTWSQQLIRRQQGIGRHPPGHRWPPNGNGDIWGPPPGHGRSCAGSGGIGRHPPGHCRSLPISQLGGVATRETSASRLPRYCGGRRVGRTPPHSPGRCHASCSLCRCGAEERHGSF